MDKNQLKNPEAPKEPVYLSSDIIHINQMVIFMSYLLANTENELFCL
jgi:hypothetical protein